MPSSNLPSSFASAAAGQNAGRDARGARGDGRGGAAGDWSRREGRSINGTLTFRRSSTTPLGQTSQPPPPSSENAVQPASIDAPTPQIPLETGPARYTRDELLSMYAPNHAAAVPSHLFIPGWDPDHVNGNTPRAWGKSNENHVPQEPGACWEPNGQTIPMGLQSLSTEEKETLTGDINSPMKPPLQNKEGQQGQNGRKASLSQGTGNNFNVNSPSSASRPGTRRRETVDSNPFSAAGLASPTTPGGRFARGGDESPWFSRKGGDLRESEAENPDSEQQSRESSSRLPFGGLTRSVTTGSSASAGWPSGSAVPGAGGFGNFAMGSGSAIGDKRGTTAAAGSSRLAHLMPKDNADAASPRGEVPNPMNQNSWRSRPRTDTDPFGDDTPTGSAALGGAQDSGPSSSQGVGRIGALSTPVKGSAGDFGMAGLSLGGNGDENAPLSPSETNPYRSPAAIERNDENETERSKTDKAGQHEAAPNLSGVARGFPAASFVEGSDRSQTSSVGAKGFPLPGVAGWPGAPGTATPDRERTYGHAFGNSLFTPMGDLQSPGLSNLNSVFGPASAGPIGTGSIGRGSKLGSLFPAAMQAQMHGQEQDTGANTTENGPDLRQSNPLGAIGRSNFPTPSRDTESPMRPNRGVFEELFPTSEMQPRSHTGGFGASDAHQGGPGTYTPTGAGGLPFGAPPMAEPTPGQIRQMVMPDRMRWVYLDPQSQIQGPFTGLEMNDWYKANFFTPDLRVKKVEDSDFEPLGQLIRRIGNSREPFLVPQIGVAHGPAPPQGGPFAPTNSGVVPPLSGVFPSFGRTLTAEEQNNLERRKQEEQYMMAQQRDFIMRQQAMSKYPMPGHGLQHHSSAHSLQSQPSFGSMTSPAGVPPQHQPIGAIPGSAGFFDAAMGASAGSGAAGSGSLDPFSNEELSNLTIGERQMLSGLQDTPEGQQAANALLEAAHMRQNLPDTENLEEDSEGFRERLKQFEGLRAQHDAEQLAEATAAAATEAEEDEPAVPTELPSAEPQAKPVSAKTAKAAKKKALEEASLSLTQQVQQAQAEAAAAAAVQHMEEPDMPMPFPPPSSSTPLPAPTAQRARSNLPEQYSRSQSGTPDVNAPAQPPPMAPWAKDAGSEAQRGPSLKEIQEAEARKAAKAEEAAAAQRRAAMELEVASLREREKAAAAAAGLPASSTWGHGSPVSPASPWTKPGSTKGPAPGLPGPAPTSNKKTLAEIQREEEIRKQKAAAREAPAVIAAPTASVSKSYANLASKPGQSGSPLSAAAAAAAAPPPGAGWSTVGAGGRVKMPAGAATQARPVSSPLNKPTVAATPVKAVAKPAPAVVKSSETTAMEEFNKWVHRELSRGITGVNDIANFQATLDVLPLDQGIIADAVYANSTTMDGRHFAEEFVRRKKLAEKGVVAEKSSDSKSSPSAGGWSEVAKKGSSGTAAAAVAAQGPAKDTEQGIQGAGFKVVPSRKKGKK